MKLKQKIAEFHKWQRKPTQFTHDPTLQNHCQCCGEEYRGNFCPVCGQPAGKGDVSWSSIKDGVMELWGMHTRSLLRSLWQLILRPGYFIAEYISGRRQVSFPPVKMLVIMALVILLITDFFSYDIDEVVTPITPGDVKSTVNHYSDIILNWAASHYDWACLVFLSFLIFPTWVIFRYSPRCTRHTLPQGFFIQVFNSTQMIIIIFLTIVLTDVIDTFIIAERIDQVIVDSITNIFFVLVIVLMLVRTYRQLFGYRLWGTTWRVLATVVSGFGLLNVFTRCIVIIIAVFMGAWDHILYNTAPKLLVYATFPTVILLISHIINKYHYKHNIENF